MVCLWLLGLQDVPPPALLMGMTVAYVLCFAGLLFAYFSYRRRHHSKRGEREEQEDDNR